GGHGGLLRVSLSHVDIPATFGRPNAAVTWCETHHGSSTLIHFPWSPPRCVPKMGDVNFIALDGVENKIAKAGNNDHTRIRFVDFSALIRRLRQFHCPVDQAGHDTRRGSRISSADIGLNAIEIVERRARNADLHPPWRR